MKKTILVTGAAGGIGSACVRLLLEHDEVSNVVAMDVHRERLAGLQVDPSRLLTYRGDVSSPADVEEALRITIDRFGRIDGLLHLAAIKSTRRWNELSGDELNDSLRVNVTGSFLMAQAAAKHMVRQTRGSIVLTSSATVAFGPTGGIRPGRAGLLGFERRRGCPDAFARQGARPARRPRQRLEPGHHRDAAHRGVYERAAGEILAALPSGAFWEARGNSGGSDLPAVRSLLIRYRSRASRQRRLDLRLSTPFHPTLRSRALAWRRALDAAGRARRGSCRPCAIAEGQVSRREAPRRTRAGCARSAPCRAAAAGR